MTKFMQWRDRLRTFIGAHELLIERIKNALFALAGLIVLTMYFGYAPLVHSWWVILGLTVLAAFMPQGAVTLMLLMYLLIDLASLSFDASAVLLVMLGFSFALCGVYQVNKVSHLISIMVFYGFHVPYVIPMEAALMGSLHEVVTIVCGSVISFFLKEVHDNAGLLRITNVEEKMTAAQLVQENVIANPMFYVYLLAMLVMFLVVYVIRGLNIRHSWIIAVVSGVGLQFVIMLGGYLFIGPAERIPMLIVADLVTLAVGILITYLYLDLDYTRIEKVQFEDDEYYYYVTAVPKIRIAEEEKEVKKLS